MKISQAFPSKYFKGAGLVGQELTLTIADVQFELIEMANEEKLVVRFDEHSSALILNQTNATTIAAAYGDDTDEWFGRRVVLYAEDVDYQGRTMPGIKVRAAGANDPAPMAARPPARSLDANAELASVADDAQESSEVPF